MAGEFRLRLVRIGLMPEFETVHIRFGKHGAARRRCKLGIVIAGDPVPVEPTRQIIEQVSCVRAQPPRAAAIVETVPQAPEFPPTSRRDERGEIGERRDAVVRGQELPKPANQLAFSKCRSATISAFLRGQNNAPLVKGEKFVACERKGNHQPI